jgi:hypothetical protein
VFGVNLNWRYPTGAAGSLFALAQRQPVPLLIPLVCNCSVFMGRQQAGARSLPATTKTSLVSLPMIYFQTTTVSGGEIRRLVPVVHVRAIAFGEEA